MVELRKLSMAHAQDLAAIANNKKIADNLRDIFPNPYSEKDALDFIFLVESKEPTTDFGIFFNKELCGVIGITLGTDVNRYNAEVGFWIGENFWGKGIANQAIQLICEYTFNELAIKRIWASVFSSNSASMKVLEKNGFIQESIKKESVYKNGKFLDEYIFVKFKED